MDDQKLKNPSHSGFMMAAAVVTVGIVALSVSDVSLAGAGGAEFDDIWTTLKDWTQGTLGRIVAGAMMLVGIVGGIARQSLMSFATGIGGGMGTYYSPTIIENIMSATLPATAEAAQFLNTIGNGLM